MRKQNIDRCTTIPHFEKNEIDELFGEDTSIAYDENHKRYDVPASMTYREWKEGTEKQRRAWANGKRGRGTS